MKKIITAVAAPPLRDRIVRSAALSHGRTFATLIALALLAALSAHAQPPVLQRGYDANVSGATLSETTLKTSNVVPTECAGEDRRAW